MKTNKFFIITCYFFLTSHLFSISAFANPVLDNVAAGNVNVTGQNTPHVEVTQHTPQAILNWQSFNIPQQESVHFNQPANGIALNRINGNNGISQIAGRLSSNGRIILINPAGIHFSPTAKVDVAGLIASTANITDKNFLKGNFVFESDKNSRASIINEGSIKAADHGFVALMAPHVVNKGHINARLGKIGLYSTDKFVLHFEGNNLIHFGVPAEHVKDAVNTGTLIGGSVYVSAKTATRVLDNAIKMDKNGIARSVYQHEGKIIFSANEPGQHDVIVNRVVTSPSSSPARSTQPENRIESRFLQNLNENYFNAERPARATPALSIITDFSNSAIAAVPLAPVTLLGTISSMNPPVLQPVVSGSVNTVSPEPVSPALSDVSQPGMHDWENVSSPRQAVDIEGDYVNIASNAEVERNMRQDLIRHNNELSPGSIEANRVLEQLSDEMYASPQRDNSPQPAAEPSTMRLVFRFNKNQQTETVRLKFRFRQDQPADTVKLAFKFNPQKQQAPAEPVRLAFRFHPQAQPVEPVNLGIPVSEKPVNHYPLLFSSDYVYEAPQAKKAQVKNSFQIIEKSDLLEYEEIAAKNRAPIEVTYEKTAPTYTFTGCVKPVDGSAQGQNNCTIPSGPEGNWVIE
jgi:filamentous hemagglutinin family protein